MMIAMAHVMLRENLCDQQFLDTNTLGFDKFRDYVLGVTDGLPKTPKWAEAITGVPAVAIEGLAREYASARPAALLTGWGPGRSAAGEQYHRAAITLAAMTGNIGVTGGSSGALGDCLYLMEELPHLPEGENPVELSGRPQRYRLPSVSGTYPVSTSLHSNAVWEAILKGDTEGHPGYKFLYVAGSNLLNRVADINKGLQALSKLEFIVVHEPFLTATARYADIVLPVNNSLERNDIGTAYFFMSPYYLYYNKAVETRDESKSDFEICAELAPRLGIDHFSDKTEDQWLREIAAATEGFGDYESTKQEGVRRIPLDGPLVAFEKQVRDHAPFPTASGKMEIYSQRIADMGNPRIPAVPQYVEAWEGPNDPLAGKYPLQLITPHSKLRSHSVFYNVPWLRELEPHALRINAADALVRGIRQGDRVKVVNDRGQIVVPALVTERIMPGVVSLDEGAWYQPDEKGVDLGGCANVLTRDGYSAGGAHPCNTCLVEVAKA